MTSLNSVRGVAVLTAVGISSWLGGQYVERNRISNHGKFSFWKDSKVNELNSFPGLPTVPSMPICYAATPFLPSVPSEKVSKQVKVASPQRMHEIMKYGYPTLENIRSFGNFILAYDTRNKIPYWTFEHLSKDKLKISKEVNRSLSDFHEDNSIHSYFRSTNKDYLRSGYDRGHLVAAGNHKMDQDYVDQTFVLSNIAPQVGVGFNRDAWNKLEKYVRSLIKKYSNVYVCTGPLFLSRPVGNGKRQIVYEVIGNNEVAVPTHFFKVLLLETDNNNYEIEAYIMPNEVIPTDFHLESYRVPPDAVERHAGFLLFTNLKKDKITHINGKRTTYV